MKKKDLQVRSSIAGTMEEESKRVSCIIIVKHVTIVRNKITSRMCADHGKESMDWA